MEKKVMSFTVLIEQGEDGRYIARVPDIKGCYTQGRTIGEVMERVKEAIQVCLEADKDIEPMKFVALHQVKVSA